MFKKNAGIEYAHQADQYAYQRRWRPQPFRHGDIRRLLHGNRIIINQKGEKSQNISIKKVKLIRHTQGWIKIF